MDKIYKVVSTTRYDGISQSYDSYFVGGYLNARYKIGKFAVAWPELLKLGYGLTAFDSLSDAIEFASGDTYALIYEATGKGRLTRMGLRKACVQIYDFNDFLRWGSMYQDWPEGTVMFQGIRLDAKVLAYPRHTPITLTGNQRDDL